MSVQSDDLLSMIQTAEGYLMTQLALYMEFKSVLMVDAGAQHRSRTLVEGFGLEAAPTPAPTSTPLVQSGSAFGADDSADTEEVNLVGAGGAALGAMAAVGLGSQLVGDSSSSPEPEPKDSITGSVLDLSGIDLGEPAPAFDMDAPTHIDEPDDDDDIDFGVLDFGAEEESPAVAPSEEALPELNIDALDLLDDDIEELTDDDDFEDLETIDFEEIGAADEPTQDASHEDLETLDIDDLDFEDDGEDETVVIRADEPLAPLPEFDDDSLGDPDETEDLLQDGEPLLEELTGDEPLLEEDTSDPIPELVDMEIEGPGEDALVTIEDTSDPRSDLEGLSRLGDSDLDHDPDTGNDEVVVRMTEEPLESFDLMPDSDLSVDDEETFIADLADIEKMKAKMASLEDTGDDQSESEVMVPRVSPPKAAAAPVVAGVRAGGPRVTAGLYGNPTVPQIRDRNAPKPRAAAVQIGEAQEQATFGGGAGGPLLEEAEVLALGSSEDYGEEEEDVEPGGSGFSLGVQEYEEEVIEYEEEEEEEVAPPPVIDDTADPNEIISLTKQAEDQIEEGQLEAAIDLYSDILDMDPDNVSACVARGRLYLDFGDYSRAMSDFMIAEELAPDNPDAKIAVGDLFFARKDYSRAIGHFNEALQKDPNHAMAYCRRGISHYYRKHYADALADLSKAKKLDDDIPNIRTYIAMAKKKAR